MIQPNMKTTSEYKIAKINLLDTNIFADFFDDEAYSWTEPSDNLEFTLMHAIDSFKEFNPTFSTYIDWTRRAEDGAYEIEIFDENPKSIFRASMILLSIRVERALYLALKYHQGQIRKGDGKQYIIHILGISRLLFGHGGNNLDIDVITASICHDLLEDTTCTEEEIEANCGPEVLRIVKAVSNDPELESKEDWEDKKIKYIESVKAGERKAMIVCLADKIVNLRALLRTYKQVGETVWERFNRGKEKKLWFEKKVLEMLKENLDHPLVEAYERHIREVEMVGESASGEYSSHPWDGLSEREKQLKHASMMTNLASFVESGELDDQ